MRWFRAASPPARAPRMARLPSVAERRCYTLLAMRYGDDRFGAQRVVGEAVVDFLFFAERVVLEVDGPTHEGPFARLRDARRDEALRASGHAVLRVSDRVVMEEPARLLLEIDRLLKRRAVFLGRLVNPRRTIE